MELIHTIKEDIAKIVAWIRVHPIPFILALVAFVLFIVASIFVFQNPDFTQIPLFRERPGKYACDPNGLCNLYGDTIRKANCTKTFADPNCLNQCSDPKKRCKI